YSFVHGDIWRAMATQPQDGVAGRRFKSALAPLKVNANVDVPSAEESRGTTVSLCHWRRPGAASKRTPTLLGPLAQSVSGLAHESVPRHGFRQPARAKSPCPAVWRDI